MADVIAHSVLMYKDTDAGCVPYRWFKYHLLDVLKDNEIFRIAITDASYQKCLGKDDNVTLNSRILGYGRDRWEEIEPIFESIISGDLSGGFDYAALFHLFSHSMANMDGQWLYIDRDEDKHATVINEPWTIMEGYLTSLNDILSPDVKTSDDLEYEFANNVSKRRVSLLTRFIKWLMP